MLNSSSFKLNMNPRSVWNDLALIDLLNLRSASILTKKSKSSESELELATDEF
ncbi:hypothetical protein TSUD_375170 [Trifolium subterraneum]|uniref:Uncharacterized protein n=1 Tax=Trifolium subterraneum TaxID=3900 RepID=A0A2Z6NZ45_TRISU|nr:hypothetical protein TSUD_375170 [Trifolium subterraneum]